jgi:tRNA G18 (ribose-2'-O)-methylase SpoU
VAVERVTDLDDPRLADYRHLRAPSRRMAVERHRGSFTLEGALSVEALLASPYAVRSVLVAEEHADKMVARLGTEVALFAMPAAAMTELTGVHFHRGVLAVAERRPLRSVRAVVQDATTIVALEGVNDHENIGAIFRNAAAFGADAVILDPTTADPLYRRATRVSLGHVLRVPFARTVPWPDALDELRELDFTTVALTPNRAAESLRALVTDPPPRVALLVGAEGPGLTGRSLAAADKRVRIPMADEVDSVNVATAVAIVLSALFER